MNPYTKGLLITLLGVLVISPDALLIRLVSADVWTLAFWRGLLNGLAVLFGFWLISRGQFWLRLRELGWPGFWVTLIFAAGSLCFIYSITHTLVANTLFLTATSPVFAALMSRYFLKERVAWRTWFAIAMTLAGVGVIASGSLGEGRGGLDGDLAAIGAAITLAATFTIARMTKTRSMVPAMGLAGLVSAIAALPLATTLVAAPADWLWIGLLGLVVSPIGFALLTTGPRYLPAPDVSLMLLLESVFGPLLVWLVLAEYPGDRSLVGGAIVLSALVLSNVFAMRARSSNSLRAA
jgi:drug/metabolite transporter (DMT)-like permease